MDNKEFWSDRSESIVNITKAFQKFQSELEPVKKEANNPFFKSKYAELSTIWDAIRPILDKNGLAILQEPGAANGQVTLATTLLHTSGEYFRSVALFPVVKQDPQGYGSAITYARRYTLQSITGVAPEDDDGNAGSQGNLPPRSNPQPANNFVKKQPEVQGKWTGDLMITSGKNQGKKWKELDGDTVEWYKNNSKNPLIKQYAMNEIDRRDQEQQAMFEKINLEAEKESYR
jgi:hypothetical protein